MKQPLVFLDIETIPSQSLDVRERIAETIKQPANMSKPETIQRWMETARADAIERAMEKTALDGALGEVWSIAWAVDDGPVICSAREGLDDWPDNPLNHFFSSMRKLEIQPVFVGHNVRDFDLRFLYHQAVVFGVRPGFWLPHNVRPDDTEHVFDTMHQWAGWGNRISLDDLCFALGIPGKGDMSGADVWPAVQRGDYDDVKSYNIEDVERVRQVYARMTFQEV